MEGINLENMQQSLSEEISEETREITPPLVKTKKHKKRIIVLETEDDEEEVHPNNITIKITDNERQHYSGPFSSHAFFKTPEEEYELNKTRFKVCNKCNRSLSLNAFKGNTSGKDPFDKNGYRLKRGECEDCGKGLSKGKNRALSIAKNAGISFKAPPGTKCEICKKEDNIVFDHHHTKEEFRGWLCNGCNRSIGMLGENIEKLVDVINYLNKLDNRTLHFDEDEKILKIV
jgi:hypothetical protein